MPLTPLFVDADVVYQTLVRDPTIAVVVATEVMAVMMVTGPAVLSVEAMIVAMTAAVTIDAKMIVATTVATIVVLTVTTDVTMIAVLTAATMTVADTTDVTGMITTAATDTAAVMSASVMVLAEMHKAATSGNGMIGLLIATVADLVTHQLAVQADARSLLLGQSREINMVNVISTTIYDTMLTLP
jgi:hypothetical protein